MLQLAGHEATVKALEWSSSSNTLISGGLDGNARLWSIGEDHGGVKLLQSAQLPHMRDVGLSSQQQQLQPGQTDYSCIKSIFWNVRSG